MAAEAALTFSVASVVEDVLQQHGTRPRDLDLESRRAEETASRRYEAARWLRKMVGVVGARDLPAEPSEEEFRLGLRSGIILCCVLNKVQPTAVPKVVESPCDSALIPDGAALSAYQYFENVRNFLVAVQELGLPTFEASDLEQGGKSARVVNCVLALKSYCDWKQTGGNGVWKFGGNVKPTTSSKSFLRKNSEPFVNSLSRNLSMNEKSVSGFELDTNKMPGSNSLGMLVRSVLVDKKPEEVSTLVESVLNKVMEEFEHHMKSQNEPRKALKDMPVSHGTKFHVRSASGDVQFKMEDKSDKIPVSHGTKFHVRSASGDVQFKMEDKSDKIPVSHGTKFHVRSASGDVKFKMEDKSDKSVSLIKSEECCHKKHILDEESKARFLKQQMLFEQRQRDIQELKHTLRTTKAGMQFMQMKFQEEFHNLGAHIHGLAHAASGYHRVLEENRKLYNQVQDLKGSIRVYCRVRPFMAGQANYLSSVDLLEDGNITISTPSKYGKGRKSFSFNKVFGPSATQAEVFADTQPLIRSVLDGFNVCIFAYGQTGSGKTYTMSGPKELTEQSQGVNYRALGDLFLLAEQRKDTFRYDVSVQMIEIYNEQVRDLLVMDGLNKRLEIRNSSQTGLNVPDASLVSVSSTSDVIYLMNLGHKNRAVGSTALNDRSSRSHSCLTVHVQGKDLTSGTILRGCMHLVDLAGSERVDKSEVTGDRLKEAQHINKSLSALGDVISSLAQKNPHVPYRNSKLTQLLQDSLGGQAKTLMFVHISPEPDSVGETISTLKFAERVATVELGAARINKDGSDVKELKEQIASLKATLARREGEPEQMLHSMPGSSDKGRAKVHELSPFHSNQQGGDVSPFHSNQQGGDVFGNHSTSRQPMGDVGNIEVQNTPVLKQRKQSCNLDEGLVNSPPWPPVMSTPGQDDRELCAGEWVDKVMVNKQDVSASPLGGCWEADTTQLPDDFYKKYLHDSSTIYPEQSYNNIFTGSNRLDIANTDILDEEIASSDSEPDLLWQFNHTKLPTLANGVGSKMKKSNTKPGKSPELRKLNTTLGPSPSRKLLQNGVGPSPARRGGRQPVSAEGKRKTVNKK